MGGGVDAGRADVELLDQPGGQLTDRRLATEEPLREWLLVVAVEHHVVGDREGTDQPVAIAVLGHVADAEIGDGPRVRAGDVVVAEHDGAGHRRPHAGDRLDELSLAVALDPGDAEDLTRPDGEAEGSDRLGPPIVGDGESVDPQHRLTGGRRLLLDGEDDVASHHQVGEILLGGGGRIGAPHGETTAEHRDAVGDGEHLAQLVGDEHDRLPLVDQRADHIEEVVDLAGGHDGGGLVEDEDLGVALEGLDQLDPLLDADRQLTDDGIGLHRQAVAGADLADAGSGDVEVEPAATAGLVAEGHVLGHGERRDQLEVLVHHADAQLDGIRRTAEVHRFAPNEDLAGVGLVQPVQHVHQGRLAGAVLAEQAVDLPGAELEVDVLVGDHTGEGLGDPAGLQHHWRVVGHRHGWHPFTVAKTPRYGLAPGGLRSMLSGVMAGYLGSPVAGSTPMSRVPATSAWRVSSSLSSTSWGTSASWGGA